MAENNNKVKNPNMNAELEKAAKQFDDFSSQVTSFDENRKAPREEVEAQTKMSQKEISSSKDVYLKPTKTIGDRIKFNDTFRKDWEFQKEYVQFIAEHKELIGSPIEMWTHPFAGVAWEYWTVPTNKPVWAPRYVAEQIKKCWYTRMIMEENAPSNLGDAGSVGQMIGKMVASSTVQRLDAAPVNSRKSIFTAA